MNIFKILSSGDQKLKEPAVTSFLAFLLDPYETHGLKTKFLEYFLNPVVTNPDNYKVYEALLIQDKKSKEIKMKSSLIYDFDFNIEIEVSKILNEGNEEDYNQKKKRNDIDIVIEISHKADKEKKYFFIVENKLNDGAIGQKGQDTNPLENNEKKENEGKKTKESQLIKQLNSILLELEHINTANIHSVCSIFLTAKSKYSDSYFEQFEKVVKSNANKNSNVVTPFHHYWKYTNENIYAEKNNTLKGTQDTKEQKDKKTSKDSILGIYNFLNDILSKESVGLIEPLQDYTKHTIKAFMNFIDTGFKSRSDDRNKDGKPVNYKENEFDKFKNENKTEYNEDSWNTIALLKERISKEYKLQYNKTHPLSYYYPSISKGNKKFSVSKYGKGLCLHIITRKFSDYLIDELKKFIDEKLKLSYKERNFGFEIYNISKDSIENVIRISEMILIKIK